MAGTRDKKMDFALNEMEKYTTGIRFSELYKLMENNFSGMSKGAIYGFIRDLYKYHSDKLDKPSKGLYILNKYNQNSFSGNIQTSIKQNIQEEAFYQPFAEYLVNDLDECTKAIVLGGNILQDKWGTPDVVGVIKPSMSDIIKEIEIISVEIKTEINALITAFGQACAYKLFSHRVYLVIPEQSQKSDIDRLDSLCFLFGIGLITFNNTDPNKPNFQIKNRAQKTIPDTFYVNTKIKKIEDKLVL